MGNPIKTSDLYQDDGGFKKLISELEEVEKKLESLRKTETQNAAKLEVQVKKLSTTTSSHREVIEDTSRQADEIAKRYQKYSESLNDNAVKIAALKNAQRSINQVNKLEAKLLSEKEGSYNRLSAQYSLNKIRLNQMSIAERKNTKEGKELVKTTNDIYEEMKSLQEETGKHTLSVGDYGKAMRDLDGNIGAAANGISGFTGQIKALLKNPIVLFLAAVVNGVMALVNAFKRSEKGAELMARVTGVTNAVMSELVDVSVKVVEGLQNAFENPQETLKNFGKSIVDNVLNRLESIPLLLTAVGKAIKALWNRDMDELKQAGEDAFTAINQGITGLDEEQQSNFAKAVKETVKEVNEEATAFADLEVKKRNYAKANRALAKSIESLTTKEQEYQLIADDSTKSFKEQEDAAKEARKAIEQRASAEIQLAKNNLSLINAEIDLRKSNHENVETLLDAQLNAYREVMSAEREYLIAVKSNEKTVSQLKQDRLERDLDILIDGFDNQKTINERRLRDEKLTEDERIQLLQETKKLADDSFLKQIETIEKFTGERIDSNELISESDAVALNQKIRNLGLSEIIEGRLLEIIRERRVAVQDLAEAETELNEKIEKARLDAIEARRKELAEAKKAALDEFDQKQELAKSEFDLIESSARDKHEFTLNAEKARLSEILKLNEKFGSDISKVQLKTIQNQIALIDSELEKSKNQFNDIYDVFNIDLSDEKKGAIKSAFDTAKGYVLDYISSYVEQTNKAVEAKDNEVDAAQDALDEQKRLRDAGLAHNVTAAQKELNIAKANQAKALKEQKKAQRDQLKLQTLEQIGSMTTASAKIWATLGFPLAIPALAIMWGSFAAAKIKALQVTKATYGQGGLEIIGGGTHASGNDTFLGFSVNGKPAYGEKDEAHAIIPASKAKKYRSILPGVIGSLIDGSFESKYTSINNVRPTYSIKGADNGKMERSLSNIDKNTRTGYFGNVKVKGNIYTRYL